MTSDRIVSESILHVLRPYASNWTGTLGRGDLVIPHRDIPRLVQEILDAVREVGDPRVEATEVELFQALSEARRRPSIQDAVAYLQSQFVVLKR